MRRRRRLHSGGSWPQGQEQREHLRLGQGRGRVDIRNFPMERVELELPREVWRAHPWRCPSKGWR